MPITLASIAEAAVFVSALSLDAFVASFAYGSKKIKIPLMSAQVINLVCSGITGFSLLAGAFLRQYIPDGLTLAISFTILLVLGIVKLLDSITKSIIRKHDHLDKEIKFSLLNFKFILRLYANPEEADTDQSKILSPAEAASLAVALSLDGVTLGLGAAIGDINAWAVFLCSLVITIAAVLLGGLIGNKVAGKTTFNLSWLSGVILIILALAKLF